jgi:16S rRNA (guanine(966)-N(2))-methyltransferase RsmD
VLDLFSGTGSLGLEALSRGASLVHFVDKDIQSIELIRYNTENLTSNETETGIFKIIQKDVLEYLRFCNDKKWDIIFLDPPYRIGAGDMKSIFDTIARRGIAGEDSVLVYEFFFKREVGEETGSFRLVKESFFGDKKVIYLQPVQQ